MNTPTLFSHKHPSSIISYKESSPKRSILNSDFQLTTNSSMFKNYHTNFSELDLRSSDPLAHKVPEDGVLFDVQNLNCKRKAFHNKCESFGRQGALELANLGQTTDKYDRNIVKKVQTQRIGPQIDLTCEPNLKNQINIHIDQNDQIESCESDRINKSIRIKGSQSQRKEIPGDYLCDGTDDYESYENTNKEPPKYSGTASTLDSKSVGHTEPLFTKKGSYSQDYLKSFMCWKVKRPPARCFYSRHLDSLQRGMKPNKLLAPFTPNCYFNQIWNLILLIALIIDFIILPLRVSFLIFVEIQPFDYLVTVLLVLDIIVNFHTGYNDQEVVTKHLKIAKNYARKWLIPDIIVAIPFFLIEEKLYFENVTYPRNLYGLIHLITLIKLVKLFKILKSFKFSNLFRRYHLSSVKIQYLDGFIRLFDIFFLAAFLSHWLACIWHFIALVEKQISPDGETWLDDAEIADAEQVDKYAHAFYWATTTLLTVGYGDITPVTMAEVWFTSFSMLLGCGVFAFIIGNVANIVYEMRQDKTQINRKVYEVDRFMLENKVSNDIQSRVRSYMEFLYEEEHDKKAKQKDVFQIIPKGLKKDLLLDLNSRILTSNIVFAANFNVYFLRELSINLQERTLSPGEYVYQEKKNHYQDSFYFITKGKVELLFKPTNEHLKTLKVGNYFGQVQFFSGKETKFTVKSVTYGKVYYLNKNTFLRILKNYSVEKESYCVLRDQINLYNDYSGLRNKCYVCKSEDHYVTECPRLKYTPDNNKIIAIAIKNAIEFRRNFVRRNRNRFNALKNHKEIFYSAEKIQKKYNECAISQEFRNHSLNYICNLEENSEESLISLDLFDVSFDRKTEPLPTTTSSYLIDLEACQCRFCMTKKNYVETQYWNLTRLDKEKGKSKEEFINGDRSSIVFDKVHIFEKYFPHNNFDEIIHIINISNQSKPRSNVSIFSRPAHNEF